jgi:glycosyltransferase involved in cell wall biosynthesis
VPAEGDVDLSRFISPASFWAPEQLSPQPAWLEHVPFAFWLIGALRPRTLVELGTHGGCSYFAFCQAVQRLETETRCYAIDTWKGDEHAGFYDEDVYRQLRTHHDARYTAFSTLIRATFDGALPHFSDGTIDLLHIDGRHYYDDVRHDFEGWRPKLSDRGVVLMHDTNVRERDFGVSKLWEELRTEYPSFEFLHGHGLGLLAVGRALADPVRMLCSASGATTHVRDAYARLGSLFALQFAAAQHAAELDRRSVAIAVAQDRWLKTQSELQAKSAEVLRLEQELQSKSAELTQMGQELAAAKRRFAELEHALDVRSAALDQANLELAAARNRSADLQNVVEARSIALAQLTAEFATLRFRASDLEKALETRSQTLADVEAQLASVRDRAAAREHALIARTAELEQALTTSTAELGQERSAHAGAKASVEVDLAATRNRADELSKALREQSTESARRGAALQAALAARSNELQSIKASASWRFSAPLRWGAQRFPRTAGITLRNIKRLWRLLGLHRVSRLRDYQRRRQDIALIKSSPLFDEAWYLARYPDVRGARSDAAWHYLIHGAEEGRDPGPEFDSDWYLAQNPDVRVAGLNPLLHYLRYGAAEKRAPRRPDHVGSVAGSLPRVLGSRVSNAAAYEKQRPRTVWSAQPIILPGYLTVHPELTPEPRLLYNVSVSVVIPTYNAGSELYWLITKLKRQKGIRSLEVVVVDSGSSDGSEAVAAELGCNVVRITKQQFSHSFSRNLGAENATGDFLLFMVQDAYPTGDYWVHGLVSCLLNARDDDYLVAVSCCEYCRSDSELFYDVLIDTHYRFLRCRDRDRVGRMNSEDYADLRTQGQLSDLACMISRDLFLNYKFVGRYAEDLTLGIRLIRDGHKVAMLSSIPVIHSHHRPAGYYLQRGFVDVVFLMETFPDLQSPKVGSLIGAINAAAMLQAFSPKISPSLRQTPDAALGLLIEEVRARGFPGSDGRMLCRSDFGHAPFGGWLERAAQHAGETTNASIEHGMSAFKSAFLGRLTEIQVYLAATYSALDDRIASEINAAVNKALALTLGTQLGFCYLNSKSGSPVGTDSKLAMELKELLAEGV